MDRWRSMAKELVCITAITINRSARPPNAEGKPRLVVFSDGSSVAYAAVVYVIFRVPKDVASLLYLSLSKDMAISSHSTLPKDMASPGLESESSYEARLLLSKARVAPLNGMTVPRTEMNGLILGTKLVDLALSSMRDLPTSVTFCLDSECTISTVDSDNGLLKP